MNKKNQIIYFFVIIFLSYITNILLIKIKNLLFISKIIDNLFQDNNNINKKDLINSFYYFHQILLAVKYQNNKESLYLLIKFIKNHYYNCIKKDCKCKLFKECQLNKENKIENYIPKFIIILNYLFELIFHNFSTYQEYELLLLLSEHFCHLKNNPLIALSFLLNFMLKKEKKLNIFQLIDINELCKKYIYYLSSKILNDLNNEGEKASNKTDLSFIQKRTEKLNNYYIYLKKSNKMKKLICIYIDIFIQILKYKNIFNDSLSFHYYENSENINYIKINFYNQKNNIDNTHTNNKYIDKYFYNKNDTNLYQTINLLKIEKLLHKKIIKLMDKINDFKGNKIAFIFKCFLFFDLFEGGKIPEETRLKLYNSLEMKSLYNEIINTNDYKIIKKKYIQQNNSINSKFYIILDFKTDLLIKYFTEEKALKLGFHQKDIINKKLDLLMPNSFCKSHMKIIKQKIIENQIKYNYHKKIYYFDNTKTVLYPASFEFSLIYNGIIIYF